jgi:glutamate synthase domain-containing protein 3
MRLRKIVVEAIGDHLILLGLGTAVIVLGVTGRSLLHASLTE